MDGAGKDNLNILEKENCENYEIFEWPKIVQLERNKLEDCIRLLKRNGIQISVGHLKCADIHLREISTSLMDRLEIYHKSTHGKIITTHVM